MRNNDVAQKWYEGEPAKSGHMSTDGRDLWSYGLCIGYTIPANRANPCHKVALAYRIPHFVSITTSHHVHHAVRYADEVRNPDDIHPSIDYRTDGTTHVRNEYYFVS